MFLARIQWVHQLCQALRMLPDQDIKRWSQLMFKNHWSTHGLLQTTPNKMPTNTWPVKTFNNNYWMSNRWSIWEIKINSLMTHQRIKALQLMVRAEPIKGTKATAWFQIKTEKWFKMVSRVYLWTLLATPTLVKVPKMLMAQWTSLMGTWIEISRLRIHKYKMERVQPHQTMVSPI